VEVQVGYYEVFLLRKSDEVLEQAAQGGGVTIPGNVQKRAGVALRGMVVVG